MRHLLLSVVALTSAFFCANAFARDHAFRCDSCTSDAQFLQAVPLSPLESTAYVYSLASGTVRKYDVAYDPESRRYSITPDVAEAQVVQLVNTASTLFLGNGHSLNFSFHVPLPAGTASIGASPAFVMMPGASGAQQAPLPASAVDYLQGHNVGGFNLYVLGHMPLFSGISLTSFQNSLNFGSETPGASVAVGIQQATSVQATVTWPDQSSCVVTINQNVITHISGECFDSHGNRIPEQASQVAPRGGAPSHYQFGGSGYSGDFGDWLDRLQAWGVPICTNGSCNDGGEYCYQTGRLEFACLFPE